MTLTGWMTYALILSALIASAARLLELGLSRLHVPTRFLWLGALALSIGLPLASALTRRAQPTQVVTEPLGGAADSGVAPSVAPASGEAGLSVIELLSRSDHVVDGWITAAVTLASGSPASLGRTMTVLWGASSLMLGLVVIASMLRLSRRAETWPVDRLLGRDVRISPAIGPATIGVLQPRIVLPRWALGLPQDRLGLILAHEEQHVRARDPLLLVAGVALTIACPWNPLAWWSARRLKDAVEVDCDRRVLARSGDAPRYGRLLVELGSRGANAWLPVPTMTGSRSLLLRRLIMLKKAKLRTAIPTAALATMSAAGLLVVACTSDAPVATEVTESASVLQEEMVSIRLEQEDGPAYVDDVPIAPLQVAELLAAEHPEDRSKMVASIYVAPSVSYRSSWRLSQEIREAGITRVVFESGDTRGALKLVLPEAGVGSPVEVSQRNLLHLFIQPSGVVEVSRADDPRVEVVQPEEVEDIWRAEVTANENLIADVRTHPDAANSLTLEVLDALHEAEAERISLIPLEIASAGL